MTFSIYTIFCLGLYNKQNITRWLEDMTFIFSCYKQYFTHSLSSFVKYYFHHSKIKVISSRHRVISSIYFLIFRAYYFATLSVTTCFATEHGRVVRSRKMFRYGPSGFKLPGLISQGQTSEVNIPESNVRR